jgi:cell wall-associated NlpC family hydrolase
MEYKLHNRVEYIDLLNKPFEDFLPTPCYKVVQIISSRLGIQLPEVEDIAHDAIDQIHNEVKNKRWMFDEITSPRVGDLVLIRQATNEGDHIGIMVERSRFLHVTSREGSVRTVDINHPFYKNRIKGYYRWNKP